MSFNIKSGERLKILKTSAWSGFFCIFLLTFLIFCLLLIPAASAAQEFNHTFEDYSNVLSSEIYPNVDKFIKELNITQPLNQLQNLQQQACLECITPQMMHVIK